MQRDELDTPMRDRQSGRPMRERGLLCRVGGPTCIVPLGHVVETMRPLPVRAMANASPFISGVAVVRGKATIVVDAAKLLSVPSVESPSRFVLLRVGTRAVALAVGEVIGIRDVASAKLAELPPLLRAMANEAVATIGTLDHELIVVLQATKLVPDQAWAELDARGTS